MNQKSDSISNAHLRLIAHLLLILAGMVALELILRAAWGEVPKPMLNVVWWQTMGALMEKHGFFNVWTPYPPVFPALFYAAWKLIPADRLEAAWQVFNICLILAQAALVFEIARTVLRDRVALPVHAAALAALAFVAAVWRPSSMVLLGAWMDQFDYLPTALLLLGLLLLIKGRSAASAAVCGVGIMTKLFPGLLILAALPMLGLRRGLQYAAIALGVCVLIAAPFLASNSRIFMSTYRWTADRPAWESVWALAFAPRATREPLANMPEMLAPQLCEAKFTRVYDAHDDATVQFTRSLPGCGKVNLLTLPMLAVALAAVMALASQRRRELNVCRGLLLMLLTLLLLSKGFSSYFIVWAMPLVCILYPGAAGFGLCALLVLLGNAGLSGFYASIYGTFRQKAEFDYFTRLGSPHFLFWGSILARQGVLLAVAAHQAFLLWKNDETVLSPKA
ncbi:MAG TPA: glycosyltransferase 87 family protein [Planctomycetota bacterium]|nr:glycosyltransferase 87 family protein [Planctomycetota bacterium]